MKAQDIGTYWTCLRQFNIEDGPTLTNFSRLNKPRFRVTFVSARWIMDEEETNGEWVLDSWEVSGPLLSKVDDRPLARKTEIKMYDHVQIPENIRKIIEDSKP